MQIVQQEQKSKLFVKKEKTDNKKYVIVNLYPVCRKKILRHALDENFKKEPDVLQELADNKLVCLIRPQSCLQILC